MFLLYSGVKTVMESAVAQCTKMVFICTKNMVASSCAEYCQSGNGERVLPLEIVWPACCGGVCGFFAIFCVTDSLRQA